MTMIYFSVFLLFFNIILILYFYLKIRKDFSQSNYEKNMHKKMEDIMRDFNSQTDYAITILEDKIVQLQETVAAADKRLSALRMQKEKNLNEEAVIKNLSSQTEVGKNVEHLHERKRITYIEKSAIADKTESANSAEPIEIYTKKIGGESAAIIAPSTSSAIIKERIIDMAKKGASAEYISERVGMLLGEVELIISMNT